MRSSNPEACERDPIELELRPVRREGMFGVFAPLGAVP